MTDGILICCAPYYTEYSTGSLSMDARFTLMFFGAQKITPQLVLVKQQNVGGGYYIYIFYLHFSRFRTPSIYP
jgi:hypothetical protein